MIAHPDSALVVPLTRAAAICKGAQPPTIYSNGTITLANSLGLRKIAVKKQTDISIFGVDPLGEFNGIGLKVFQACNIILQNLRVHHVLASTGNGISLEGPAAHIWGATTASGTTCTRE